MFESLKNKFKRKFENKPAFMIIGAQKAGTTALYEYLSKHNNIVATKNKEIHFFNCDQRYNQGLENYHSLFPELLTGQCTFDASPGYLYNVDACERIYSFNKNTKIIILIREPVSRAYSAWNMYIKNYSKNINWFYDDWLAYCDIENEALYKKRNPNKIFNFYDYIMEEYEFLGKNSINNKIESPILLHGAYVDQIRKYLEKFGKDNVLIIENDTFKKETQNTLIEIENFLEIDAHPWPKENIQPVFEGGYNKKIKDKERELLLNYYKYYNEQLYELIGVRY